MKIHVCIAYFNIPKKLVANRKFNNYLDVWKVSMLKIMKKMYIFKKFQMETIERIRLRSL